MDKRPPFKVGAKVRLKPDFFLRKKEERSKKIRTVEKIWESDGWLTNLTGDKAGQLIRNVNTRWIERTDGQKFRSRITPKQHDQMRELFEKGYGIQFIARKFKCWPNTVWTHVYDLSPPRIVSEKERKLFTKNSKLTDKDVLKIRELGRQGVGSLKIGAMYGLSQSAALGIMTGKTYRWVKSQTTKGALVPIEFDRIRKKSDLRPGAKPGSKWSVPSGTLLELAKRYGVAPCTICRWFSKGKLKKIEMYKKVN